MQLLWAVKDNWQWIFRLYLVYASMYNHKPISWPKPGSNLVAKVTECSLFNSSACGLVHSLGMHNHLRKQLPSLNISLSSPDHISEYDSVPPQHFHSSLEASYSVYTKSIHVSIGGLKLVNNSHSSLHDNCRY